MPDRLSGLLAAIDRWQRRWLRIREFSSHPACIFRLAVGPARSGVRLADGTVVEKGDTVGIIHLWNQHVPAIPRDGPDLVWARELKHRLTVSLCMLAEHVSESPALVGVGALGGRLCLPYTPATLRLLQRLGVEMAERAPDGHPLSRAAGWMAKVWTWCLRRAFNPMSVQGLRLRDLECRLVWISRRTLVSRYRPGAGDGVCQVISGNDVLRR